MPFDCFEISKPDSGLVKKLGAELEFSEVLATLLVNRGITTAEEARHFISGSVEDLHDPYLISDMSKAVDIILKHVELDSPIMIHGDYDADGVTSTAIMIKALERLGANLVYYIPDRFDEGYGFSEDAIYEALDGGVKLIVTVDCGSSNFDAVKKAKEAGLDIIVTDHHEVPPQAPTADAFINLKKPGEKYPFHELSGAGVALKLVHAIYSRLGRGDWTDFMDYATIGIVADVCPLLGENRIIVREGLKLIAQRRHPGITKLLEISNVTRENLSPWDISFIIAPKINAAGRLADATVALEFLLEENPDKADEMAKKLIQMNEDRQKVENAMKEEIEVKINSDPSLLSQPVWVFGSRGWHQGVIGIVASRFSQAFRKPVYLISIDENGLGRGSARSGENYSVYESLNNASQLLEHFGGHQLAGGFSIHEEKIDRFREIVSESHLFSDISRPVKVDMEISPSLLNLDLAKELETLSPYGEGNAKPLFFSRQMKIQSAVTVGNQGKHLKMWISTAGGDVKGIAFGKGNLLNEVFPYELYYDVVYNLDVDVWNNEEEISLKIQHLIMPPRECLKIITGLDDSEVRINLIESDSPHVVDARKVINRRRYIKFLQKNGRRCLVLTRNQRQTMVLIENLRQEGVNCRQISISGEDIDSANNVFVAPYDSVGEDLNFEEIIFYHPPYLSSHFSGPYMKSPKVKRVHFLFGDGDVSREESNQEIMAPSREKLLKIYQCLKKLYKEQPEGENLVFIPKQLAKAMKDSLIQGVTIIIALKIFSEIDLLSYSEQEGSYRVQINVSERRDLEHSPTFISKTEKKRAFGELKDLLTGHDLDELEKIIFAELSLGKGV